MQRIALINPCPGSGKTTIAASLGHALTLAGQRVTVIDLDPAGLLTTAYGIFRAPTKGIDRVLLNGTPLTSVSIGARDLLQLIPAGTGLRQIEEKQGDGMARAQVLKQVTEAQCANQSFVLFDCPSHGGQLVANAIFAADMVLVPVTTEQISLNGALKTLLTLKRFAPFLKRQVEARLVSNRVLPRSAACKSMHVKLQNHFPDMLMKTLLPESSSIAECGGIGRTIFEYRASSPAAKAFHQLSAELLTDQP